MSNIDRIKKLIILRDEIFAWAKIEFEGQTILNIDSEMRISINTRGLKHTLKGKSYKRIELVEKNEALVMSVKHLKYFLETSGYIAFEEDKRSRDNILGYHVFMNTFAYKGVDYNVKILVRETTDKTYFYDQALIEKK